MKRSKKKLTSQATCISRYFLISSKKIKNFHQIMNRSLSISLVRFISKPMAFDDDHPSQLSKDVKRQNRKTKNVRSKDFKTLIRLPHELHMWQGTKDTTPSLPKQFDASKFSEWWSDAMRALQFLATNGNCNDPILVSELVSWLRPKQYPKPRDVCL